MKNVIWVILVLLLLSNGYSGYKLRELEDENSYLEDEKAQLEEKNKDLEDELDELKSDYKESLSEHEESLNSQTEFLNSQRENILNNNFDNKTESSENTSITTSPKSFLKQLNLFSTNISTVNFDQGRVISPTMYNLHYLFNLTQSEFERTMSNNNYSLATTKDSFVSESTRSCCYTIEKDSQSITMIFTKSIDNNIDSFLKSYGIDYNYDGSFRKYTYLSGSQKFEFYIQSGSEKLILLLKNI